VAIEYIQTSRWGSICTPGSKQVRLSVVLKDTEKADIQTWNPSSRCISNTRSVGHHWTSGGFCLPNSAQLGMWTFPTYPCRFVVFCHYKQKCSICSYWFMCMILLSQVKVTAVWQAGRIIWGESSREHSTGGNCPRGGGGNCLGGSCPGGNCPDAMLYGPRWHKYKLGEIRSCSLFHRQGLINRPLPTPKPTAARTLTSSWTTEPSAK
jgi:hypothetical protein